MQSASFLPSITLSSVACLAQQYFPTLSQDNTFGKNVLNTGRAFLFYLQVVVVVVVVVAVVVDIAKGCMTDPTDT